MKTAVIYARYSSDRQTEQSIDGQVRVCNDYAERNDILIVSQYIDRATTGTNDNRDAFQQMMKDSDKKAWDYVLVYKLDRFSRNKFEMAMHRKHLKDNGIKILSAMENIPDTPEGILLESLLEGMNQYYSEELSQKTRRGQRETRLKGLHCAGKLNYGYYTEKKKVFVHPEEGPIVKEIFERYAAGERGNEIAISFAERGILYRGKPFSAANIYVILHGEKYTGKYDLHGEVYDNIYPRIIEPELYERCKQKIDANRYGNHIPDYSYLLRRRAYCGECGTRMTSYSGTSKSGRVSKYYKCWNAIGKKNCKAKFIKKDVLDGLVIKTLQETLTGKNLSVIVDEIYRQHNAKLMGENPVKMLEKELTQINKSINNIMHAIEQGIITDTTKERLQELEQSRKELQEKLIFERMQEQVVLDKKTIEDYLKDGVKQEPEMMIDLLVDKVYVYSDHIELILHYTDQPIKPKPRIDNNDESPEGNNLRGSLIFTAMTWIDELWFKGLKKKDLEPKLKETRNMLVYIEI